MDIRTQQYTPVAEPPAEPVVSESRGEHGTQTFDQHEQDAAVHVRNQIEAKALQNIAVNNPKQAIDPGNSPINKLQNQALKKFPVQDIIISAKNVKFGKKEIDILYEAIPNEGKKLANKYGLTKQEAAAIHAYTNDYYKPINHQFRTLPLNKVSIYHSKALMKAGVENPDLAEMIAALARGVKKLPPAQTSDTIFPAVGRNVTMEDDVLAHYKEGEELSVPTFLSTTVSAKEMTKAGWWDGNDQALFIHQRVNGRGRDITAFSKYKNEQETIFLPDTRFKVTFRAAPAETKSGEKSGQAAASNTAGKVIIKTNIAMQEIPYDYPVVPTYAEEIPPREQAKAGKHSTPIVSAWDETIQMLKNIL